MVRSSRTSRTVLVTVAAALAIALAGCGGAASPHRATGTASTPVPSSAAPSTPPTSRAFTPPSTMKAMPADTPTVPAARTSTVTTPARSNGGGLPLSMSTGSASQVITVVAPSYSSTVATLQAWTRSGSGWTAHTAPISAHLGSDGLSTSPSESASATPVGSFTLTQAFGHDSNPGTSLPYVQTTPSDWWISQPGSLYNTRQRCSGSCPFTQGDPNEHLYYETPYYDYAVVIDYNTANSPTGVRQGAGSAFFLHVTDGGPTAGCVSIPQASLVSIMQWLTPSAHPRILIGVG